MVKKYEDLSVAERRQRTVLLLRWLGISDILGGLGLLLAAAPLLSGGASLFGSDGDLNGLLMIAGAFVAVMGLALWAFGSFYGRRAASDMASRSEGVVSRR